MDPNANLIEMRELVDRIELDNSADISRDAARLAELVDALDEWLSKGGFPPAQWVHAR